MGKIAYKTPPLASMIPGTTIDSFKAFDSVTSSVEIIASGATHICAKASRCTFRNLWSYTPIIYYLSPPVVYPGQVTTMAINPMNAPQFKKLYDMAIDIKIDGENFDFEDLLGMDDTLSRNRVNYVKGRVTNTIRSNTADLTAWQTGSGFAMLNEDSSTHCSFDGTGCYKAKVLPSITNIDQTTGSSAGG